MNQELVYTTDLGRAYKGDAREILTSGSVVPGSVDLIVTSPPFALTRPKDYGNRASEEYVDWLTSFVPSFQQALSDTGSQIHHLKKKEDLVGACCKAGYDGSDQIEAITNEVQLLCRRDRCLSSMPKRTERPV